MERRPTEDNGNSQPREPGDRATIPGENPVATATGMGKHRLTRSRLLGVVIALGAVLGYRMTVGVPLRLDEAGHYRQILWFLDGHLSLYRLPGAEYPGNAMLPGFHALFAGVAWFTGIESVDLFRFYNTLLSVLFALLCGAVVRRLANGTEEGMSRAAQIYFLPILFPFYFLIYTDILSLFLLVLAFWFCCRRQLVWSGVFALVSICVRQTNVVWTAFFMVYAWTSSYGYRLAYRDLWSHLKKCWMLVVALCAFGVFLLVNGRVSLDDPAIHVVSASIGNLLFSLACFSLLFLPLHLANASAIWAFTRRRPGLVIVGIVLVAAVISRYVPSHPWNWPGVLPFLLRNRCLWLLTGSLMGKTVFVALVSVGALSLAVSRMRTPADYLLYPLWAVLLVPMVLIEPRYYLPVLVFWELLRVRFPPWAEMALGIYWVGGALILHMFVVQGGWLP